MELIVLYIVEHFTGTHLHIYKIWLQFPVCGLGRHYRQKESTDNIYKVEGTDQIIGEKGFYKAKTVLHLNTLSKRLPTIVEQGGIGADSMIKLNPLTSCVNNIGKWVTT